MPNGKLRLDLAALRLKSFETTADPGAERGTVRGMDQDCGACTYCTGCTNSCGQVTWCIGSCNGPTGCGGASQTDSDCEPSWAGTCWDETCYDGTCHDTCNYTCAPC